MILGRLQIFARRLRRRLLHLLSFREQWEWEYESCERCGSCFRLAYDLCDDAWQHLYGSDGGCLCLSCAIVQAEERGRIIRPEHIHWLALFYPDVAGEFDIIAHQGDMS